MMKVLKTLLLCCPLLLSSSVYAFMGPCVGPLGPIPGALFLPCSSCSQSAYLQMSSNLSLGLAKVSMEYLNHANAKADVTKKIVDIGQTMASQELINHQKELMAISAIASEIETQSAAKIDTYTALSEEELVSFKKAITKVGITRTNINFDDQLGIMTRPMLSETLIEVSEYYGILHFKNKDLVKQDTQDFISYISNLDAEYQSIDKGKFYEDISHLDLPSVDFVKTLMGNVVNDTTLTNSQLLAALIISSTPLINKEKSGSTSPKYELQRKAHISKSGIIYGALSSVMSKRAGLADFDGKKLVGLASVVDSEGGSVSYSGLERSMVEIRMTQPEWWVWATGEANQTGLERENVYQKNLNGQLRQQISEIKNKSNNVMALWTISSLDKESERIKAIK